MDFNKNLKRYRTDKGLSQEELAKLMNVSQKTISAWEVGRNEPSMGDVIKLTKIFECSQQDLTGSTKTFEVNHITTQDLLVKINEMDYNELSELKKQIENRMEMFLTIERLENDKNSMARRLLMYEEELRKYRDKNKNEN